jgi:lactoylglutathione lyase
MDVHHACLWVSDLGATTAFYEDAIGLEFAYQFEWDGVTSYFVTGGSDAQLQFRYDPASTDPIEPSGVDHVALTVDDVDGTFESVIEETGCPIVRGPMDIDPADARTAFVEDPDGYAVEFVEPY